MPAVGYSDKYDDLVYYGSYVTERSTIKETVKTKL